MSSHFHVFFIGVLSSLVMSSGGVLCSRSLFGVPRNKLKIEQNFGVVFSSLVMSSGGVLCSRSIFGVPRNKLKIEQNMKYEKYLNILVDPT